MTKTLSDCLRDIGEEEVKIKINGQEYICTRTEATARKMHLMASGGFEEVVNEEGDEVRLYHKADAKVAKMIREFVDGKAALEPAPEKKSKTVKAGQYSSEIGRRLNERLGNASAKPKRPKLIVKGE